MDVGKFKASRTRLILWILIPPVLVLGPALTSHALKVRSEWHLDRAKALSDVLPKIMIAKAGAEKLFTEINSNESQSLQSEDELISYLRNTAGSVGFTVDSLKVDRRASVHDKNMPVLVASVKGAGAFASIQDFIRDVSGNQPLLSETYLQVSRPNYEGMVGACRADITFELLLFGTGDTGGL